MHEKDNYLKTAELSTEQNCNMIDGVPNNTPIPPTPPELDAKPLDKVKEPKERRKGREPLWNTRTHINNQTNNQLVNKRAKPAFCPPRIASQFSLAFHHVTSIFLYQNKPANPLRKSGFAGLLYESFSIQKALHSVTNKVQCFFT